METGEATQSPGRRRTADGRAQQPPSGHGGVLPRRLPPPRAGRCLPSCLARRRLSPSASPRRAAWIRASCCLSSPPLRERSSVTTCPISSAAASGLPPNAGSSRRRKDEPQGSGRKDHSSGTGRSSSSSAVSSRAGARPLPSPAALSVTRTGGSWRGPEWPPSSGSCTRSSSAVSAARRSRTPHGPGSS